MYRFGRARWSIAVEQDFQVELEEGTACISRPDGDGVLLITEVDKADGLVTHADLEALARGECPQGASLGDCELGAFRGVHAMYQDAEQPMRWHRWYLGHGSLILLATYTVPLELEGREDDAVMTMLRTLQARGAAWV